MKTGRIDILAFIGGSSAADRIIKDHPNPHRLKLFLQLEGKNLVIMMC
jgi:glyceraldehyde-3-phosphate dehydrogenase (NADP+)